MNYWARPCDRHLLDDLDRASPSCTTAATASPSARNRS